MGACSSSSQSSSVSSDSQKNTKSAENQVNQPSEETSIEVLQPFAVDQLSYQGDNSPAPHVRSTVRPSSRNPVQTQTKAKNPSEIKRIKEVQATPGIRAKVQAAAAAKRRSSQDDHSSLATQSGAVWTVPLGDANVSRSSKRSLAPLDGSSGTSSARGLNSIGQALSSGRSTGIGQKSNFLESDRNFASEGKDAEFLLAISRDRMDQILNPKLLVKSNGQCGFVKGVKHDPTVGATFLDPNDDFEDDIQLIR
jgi:hypothetical protein